MKLIYDLSYEDMALLFKNWTEPDYRCSQIWEGIYKHLWSNPNQFSQIPSNLRKRIDEEFSFKAVDLIDQSHSKDNRTTKVLFELLDGRAIESVLMEYKHRHTICISTQVGCAMGCVFCATGQMGFVRHLSSGEIIGQVLYFVRLLKDQDKSLSNIVIMGMGEPFHNYENTMAAIDRLNDTRGFKFGSRRFTISTVGIIPKIIQFANEKRQVNLAISLHAADDATRSKMLPITKSYSLVQLMDACKRYVEVTGRRISFEWAMVNGINDSSKDAHLLVNLLRGLLCHVNIIPLNLTAGYKGKASSPQRIEYFRKILLENGINCTIRLFRGVDIGAGCGQLLENHSHKTNY
jgi:23S rRNA (adenine2503-C2)-methyltransferase